jgi:hypothetical protein
MDRINIGRDFNMGRKICGAVFVSDIGFVQDNFCVVSSLVCVYQGFGYGFRGK